MSINFHPDESTLMAYAAGTLDEAFAIVVSCHLETCSSCRSALKMLELVGGSQLENVPVEQVDEGSFGRILEKISASEIITDRGDEIKPAKSAREIDPQDKMPTALRSYVEGGINDVKWKRVSPGVWQSRITLSNGAKSSLRLLRIAPGKDVPEHGHNGQEMTLILSGAYRDEIGYFGPGDVADLDVDIEHQPHVVSDEDCICLAATEAPTRFKGLASRLLQPFFGI